jgi:hypothetical protein
MVEFLITISVSPSDASKYTACAGLAAHNHEVNKARTCLTESRISTRAIGSHYFRRRWFLGLLRHPMDIESGPPQSLAPNPESAEGLSIVEGVAPVAVLPSRRPYFIDVAR